MKFLLPILSLALTTVMAGCLTAPSSSAGGLAGVTVKNTNTGAIIQAANEAFRSAGYTMGMVDYPDSISYDKPAGAFGKAMWGGYNQSTSYRATLRILPLDGDDYRLAVSVASVNDAGQAGFESARPLIGPWSAEFVPLLNRIKKQASNAGAGY